jgi:hypothetical protein
MAPRNLYSGILGPERRMGAVILPPSRRVKGFGDWGFDLSSIPVIGGLYSWTQDRAAEAVAWVAGKYRDYQEVRDRKLPDAVAQQRAIAARTDLTPEQAKLVNQWGAQLDEVRGEVGKGNGAVETVAKWYHSITGLAAFPLIPLAVLTVLALAVWTIKTAIDKYSMAAKTEALVKAGLTPTQINETLKANMASGFGSWYSGLSTAALLLLGVGVYFMVRAHPFGGGRR